MCNFQLQTLEDSISKREGSLKSEENGRLELQMYCNKLHTLSFECYSRLKFTKKEVIVLYTYINIQKLEVCRISLK